MARPLLKWDDMKFVALLVGMAIIGVLVVKRAQPSQVDEAMREADAVVQPVSSVASPPTPTAVNPVPTGLRAPRDRTRAVLEHVKQRNGNGEF